MGIGDPSAGMGRGGRDRVIGTGTNYGRRAVYFEPAGCYGPPRTVGDDPLDRDSASFLVISLSN